MTFFFFFPMLFVLVPTLSYSFSDSSALPVFRNVFIKCNCISLSLYFARLTLLSYICPICKTDSPFPSYSLSAPVLAGAAPCGSCGQPSGRAPTRDMYGMKNASPCLLGYFPWASQGFSALCCAGSSRAFLSLSAAPSALPLSLTDETPVTAKFYVPGLLC